MRVRLSSRACHGVKPMPFDGVPQTIEAAQVVDRLIEFFGGGKRWCSGWWFKGSKRCLVAALRDVSEELGVECGFWGEGIVGDVIWQAMREGWWCEGLVEFNDCCGSYREVKLVLERAREIALGPEFWTVKRARVRDRRIHDDKQLELLGRF
jgi:hypothetical protein